MSKPISIAPWRRNTLKQEISAPYLAGRAREPRGGQRLIAQVRPDVRPLPLGGGRNDVRESVSDRTGRGWAFTSNTLI